MSNNEGESDRRARLVESLLQFVEDSIHAGRWEQALSYLEDVRLLDPHHAEVPPLLQLVERHTGGIGVQIGHRFLTVLFADIVGSTDLGERLPLEPYAALMRLFESAARPIVDQYGGHIQNYFGDGVIVYFGYPIAHDHDPHRAVSAGLELLDTIRAVAPRANELYDADLKIRIGVD